MLYWIFDLDLTLYQLPQGVDFNYKHLNNDAQWIFIINVTFVVKKYLQMELIIMDYLFR